MFKNVLTQIFQDNFYCLNHHHFLSSRTRVTLTHRPTSAACTTKTLFWHLCFLLSNELSGKIRVPSLIGKPLFLQVTTLHSHNSTHITQHGTTLYGHTSTPHNSTRPQLDTAQLNTPQLDTSQFDTAQLDTTQLDTPQLYTATTQHAITVHRPHGRKVEATIE